MRVANTSFKAKYPGVCTECGQWISQGQQVERAEWRLGFVHTTCPRVKHSEDVCPLCLMERLLSGECGCPE